jgi:hypothetical protein
MAEYLTTSIIPARELKAGDLFIPFATELNRDVYEGTDPAEKGTKPKLAELPAPIWFALVDGSELPESDLANEVTLIVLDVAAA